MKSQVKSRVCPWPACFPADVWLSCPPTGLGNCLAVCTLWWEMRPTSVCQLSGVVLGRQEQGRTELVIFLTFDGRRDPPVYASSVVYCRKTRARLNRTGGLPRLFQHCGVARWAERSPTGFFPLSPYLAHVEPVTRFPHVPFPWGGFLRTNGPEGARACLQNSFSFWTFFLNPFSL